MADIDIRSFILPQNEGPAVVAGKTRTAVERVYKTKLASGVDVIVERQTVGKKNSTLYLVLLLSQKQYYIKEERNGQIKELTESSLSSFFNGLSCADDIWWSESPVLDAFQKNKTFCERFIQMLNNDVFIALAKKGLISTSCWFDARAKDIPTGVPDKPAGEFSLWKTDAERFAAEANFVKWMCSMYSSMNDIPMESVVYSMWAKRSYEKFFVKPGTKLCRLTDEGVSAFILLSKYFSLDHAKDAFLKWAGCEYFSEMASPENLYGLFCLSGSSYRKNHAYRYNDDPVETYFGEISFGIARGYGFWHTKPAIIFEPKRFIEYFFENALRSGNADNLSSFAKLWEDTLRMEVSVYDVVKEKYPEHLVEMHDYLAYKCRVLEQTINTKDWKVAAEKAATYEGTANGYVLIAPKESTDIVDEATAMNNCVASYVSRMTDGSCSILFLRKKEAPEASCCTVEIRGDKVVQFKGKRNCEPSCTEAAALQAICEKSDILSYCV